MLIGVPQGNQKSRISGWYDSAGVYELVTWTSDFS